MKTWTNENFSRGWWAEVASGDIFDTCNFSQSEPHTPVLQGLTGLTFINCNLTNCDVPADSSLTNCNATQVLRHVWIGTETVRGRVRNIYEDQVVE